MTFSPLISGMIPHNGKYSSRQGKSINKFLQHHWAGTTGGVERMTGPDQASANYIILTDGRILGHVPEEFRAWTSGSFAADGNAITLEVQNISGQVYGDDNNPASWRISDAALASIIRLVADVAKRHGWGAISTGTYQGHRQWSSTACPGGYLWSKMDSIRGAAQSVLNGGSIASPAPVPSTPPVGGKTVWQLADEVLAGLHGSGEARRASLGGSYDAVQAEINRRFGVGTVAAAPKSIAQLADEVLAGAHGNGDQRIASLGANYSAVQAEINSRLGGGGAAPQGVNISQLADAVLRGEYGNGDDRKARLGGNYEAVQNEINRRSGVGAIVVQGPNINDLVSRTLRGEFGNGDARAKALGANYQAVQNEINRRYN